MRNLIAPGNAEGAQPVFVGDLGQVVFIVAGVFQNLQQVRQGGGVGQPERHLRAVEVGTQGDVVDADQIDDVVDVAHDAGQGRVFFMFAIGAYAAGHIVKTDQPTATADRFDLLVGDIARRGADGVHGRMAGDQRRGGEFSHLPESFLVEMGQVN